MRTTVTLDPDIAAAVDELKRSLGVGPSEAINRLARAGLVAPRERLPFVQRSEPLGLLLDVSNIGEALEIIEGPEHR